MGEMQAEPLQESFTATQNEATHDSALKTSVLACTCRVGLKCIDFAMDLLGAAASLSKLLYLSGGLSFHFQNRDDNEPDSIDQPHAKQNSARHLVT